MPRHCRFCGHSGHVQRLEHDVEFAPGRFFCTQCSCRYEHVDGELRYLRPPVVGRDVRASRHVIDPTDYDFANLKGTVAMGRRGR